MRKPHLPFRYDETFEFDQYELERRLWKEEVQDQEADDLKYKFKKKQEKRQRKD